MATRVRERATGERCKRGAPIIERIDEYIADHQAEPFETLIALRCCRCCRECDAERD